MLEWKLSSLLLTADNPNTGAFIFLLINSSGSPEDQLVKNFSAPLQQFVNIWIMNLASLVRLFWGEERER